MNTDLVLKTVKPYLNEKNEISESEFIEAFNMLTLREQYKVIDILIKYNIDLVDYKEENFTKIEYSQSTNSIEQISSLKMPTKAKDIKLKNEQLCIMYQKGNLSALAMLLIKNEPFINETISKIEKKYNHKLEPEDIFQAGRIGLINAAQRFDIAQGFSFLTYAWYWIKQSTIRSIMNEGYTIRIPVHCFELVNKLSNTEMYLYNEEQENDLNIDKQEKIDKICEKLNITRKKYQEIVHIRERVLKPASLNQLVGIEEKTELIDLIPSERIGVEENFVEDEAEQNDLINKINEVLKTLSEREQKILKLRFGFDNGNQKTLEEVGNLFGVTRERIRQIEAKALRKLRHPNRSKKLKVYLMN